MAADVEAAVAAAEAAWAGGQGAWAQMSASARGDCVKKMCAGIVAHQEMLAAIEAADTGKVWCRHRIPSL